MSLQQGYSPRTFRDKHFYELISSRRCNSREQVAPNSASFFIYLKHYVEQYLKELKWLKAIPAQQLYDWIRQGRDNINSKVDILSQFLVVAWVALRGIRSSPIAFKI